MDEARIKTIEEAVSRGELINFEEADYLIKEKQYDILKKSLDLDRSLVKHQSALGETLLIRSMYTRDNKNIIELLLDRKSDIEATDNRGFTALCTAVKNEIEENIIILLDHGAQYTITKDNRTKNPLSLALKSGNKSLVNIFRDRNVNLILPENERFSFLMYSIDKYDTELLKELLALDEYVNHVNDRESGRSLLIRAIQLCKYELEESVELLKIILILLERKSSIGLQDYLVHDAFFLAAQFGHIVIVDYFIKSGYILNSTNLMDEYKYEYTDHPNVIFAAFKYNVGLNSCDKLILKLIDFAPSNILNHTDRDRNTLLHLAAQFRNKVIYQKLLDMAVDKNIRNNLGLTAENIYTNESESKYISYYSYPGQRYLGDQINLSKNKCVNDALQSGVKIHIDHVVSAIEMFDSNIPGRFEKKQFYVGEKYLTLDVLLKYFNSKNIPGLSSQLHSVKQKWIIKVALTNAIHLEKYKVVHFIYHRHISKKEFPEITKYMSISLKMRQFLQENLEIVSISPFQADNAFNYKELLHKKFNFMPYYTAGEFFVEYIKWKANDYNDNIMKYDEALPEAISYRQIDIATFLIQQGPSVTLKQEHEEFIETYFPEDFKRLYKESKGSGFLTLEQTARIAVRKDLRSFHEAWSNDIIRSILQFQSKMYKLDSNDPFMIKALHFAILSNNYYFLENVLYEPEKSEFINYLFIKHQASFAEFLRNINFQFSNLLFPAIKDGDLETLKHLIEVERVNVNGFNGEMFNAFHYAIILGRREVIELLEKYGNKKCRVNSSPKMSYEELEQLFSVSKCDGEFETDTGVNQVHGIIALSNLFRARREAKENKNAELKK